MPEIVGLPCLLNVQKWCVLRSLVGCKWLIKGQVRKFGFRLFLPVVIPKGVINAILEFLFAFRVIQIESHKHGSLPHGHRSACQVAGFHLLHPEVTRCCTTCILLHLLTDFRGLHGFLLGTLAVWINRFARAWWVAKASRRGKLADAGVGCIGFDGERQSKMCFPRNLVIKM